MIAVRLMSALRRPYATLMFVITVELMSALRRPYAILIFTRCYVVTCADQLMLCFALLKCLLDANNVCCFSLLRH